MNSGLLTGFRNRQPPWWGTQDANQQVLDSVGAIGIADASYGNPPPVGTQGPDANNLLVIGAGVNSNQRTISDGSSFNGILLQKSITVDTVAAGTLTGISVVETVNALQNITQILGFNFQPQVFGSGTVGLMQGINVIANASIGSTVTTMVGIRVSINCQAGTVTTAYGIDIRSNDILTDPVTTIGLSIGVVAALKGQTVWGMQVGNYQSYHQGPLTIGAAAAPVASSVLDLSTTTGALVVPRMTTTQKNALTPLNGMVIYDSTLNKIQCYQGGAWTSLA